MKFSPLIFGILSSFFSACSMAAELQSKIPTALPSSPLYLLKLVLGLIAVLLLFSAIAWLIRRFGLGGLMHTSNGELKIIESLSLGSRERLVIVEAGKEKLLLGVTSGQINKIHLMNAGTDKATNFSDHLTQQKAKS
jgi:flagellar protein FliO/FliZ